MQSVLGLKQISIFYYISTVSESKPFSIVMVSGSFKIRHKTNLHYCH